MAFFGVTIEKIEKVWDHSGADRLSMAKVEGLSFQFIIGKNQFKPGDEVAYFPLDAILPNGLLEKINLVGKLSGKDKNRVKTAKFRGLLSQGLVVPWSKILTPEQRNLSSEEITSILGVTKYEPPIQMSQDGILTDLPNGFGKYDIEGADRFQNIIDLLMDQEVVVMEKMEGTNLSVTKSMESELSVNQRNNSIVENGLKVNSYWQASRDANLLSVVEKLPPFSGIYGELTGPSIQSNIYSLKKHSIYVFDIRENGSWMGWKQFNEFVKENNILTAPILFVGKLRDFLQDKTVQEMSNGKSVVNPLVLREGIVIKPTVEQWHEKIGRLIIKQRSPEYLANEK